MFTGIIKHQGIVNQRSTSSLSIEANKVLIKQLSVGESVSVNGVCLTVREIADNGILVDIMPETLRATNLGKLELGNNVNLELPLKADSFLGGHIVQGHIDGTATVHAIKKAGSSHLITFTAKPQLLKYMVEKGSITIDGISLTLISVDDASFSVGIIPHTWQHTTLKHAVIGIVVNIEIDILAKYAYKFTPKERTV